MYVDCFDTSIIGTDDFVEIIMDYCIFNHTDEGTYHNFTFEIDNSSWCGNLVVTSSDDDASAINSVTYDSTTNTVSVSADSSAIKVYVICSDFLEFNFDSIDCYCTDHREIVLNYSKVGDEYDFTFFDVTTGTETVVSLPVVEGVNVYSSTDLGLDSRFVCIGRLMKTPIQFNCNQRLVAGKLNKVKVGVASDYLPSGSMVSSALNLSVEYDGEIIPCVYDSGLDDYYFDIDLTDQINTSPVLFNLVVDESDTVSGGVYPVKLKVSHITVGSYPALVSEIQSGAKYIEFSSDITFDSRILITQDIIIDGKGYVCDLNSQGLNIINGANVTIKNLSFDVGDTAIIQQKNTSLDLENCIFTNCTSSNFNNLGSAIYCDVDIESLTENYDFSTSIENCIFKDNQSSIFHGGELLINNSIFRHHDYEMTTANNPAFLYQTDGGARITNSVFDIDYGDDSYWCANEESIGFAQALFHIGETALLNGANYNQLSEEEIPFFENPYRNQGHIFAKYYYPAIDECVYISPELNQEAKSLCYCLTGSDYIFKKNAQITKASDEKENRTHKIIWED